MECSSSEATVNTTISGPSVGGVNLLCVLDGAISKNDPVVPKLESLGLKLNFVK